jgi:hypothetical protein
MGITPPNDWADVKQVRPVKKLEMGAKCTEAIYAGVEVGGKHYALTAYDQTQIMGQLSAVQQGAPAVPYHADGELCRMFTAEEFMEVANAAMQHIFWHRTYCNHLNAWIKRGKLKEIAGIVYGVELPADLAESMAALMAAAGGDTP